MAMSVTEKMKRKFAGNTLTVGELEEVVGGAMTGVNQDAMLMKKLGLATLPAIGIIMILHYCRYRKEYQKTAENCRNWRFSAIIGTVAGLLSGFFIPLGNSSINSMSVAAAVWYVCQLWENRLAKGAA